MSNNKPHRRKPQNRNEKPPRRPSEKKRKPLQKPPNGKWLNCSSRFKSRRYHLEWIRRRYCVYSTNRVIVRKEGSASSVMILPWSGKRSRRISIRTRGRERKRRRRRMTWRTGTRVNPTLKAPTKPMLIQMLQSREAPPSRPQQTRQPENHHRQSLQTLHRRRRRRQIRLVLDLPQRRRQMHVQALPPPRFRPENKRAARRRESPDGQITLENTDTRRLFRIGTA